MSSVNLIRPPYIVDAGPFAGVYTSRQAYEEYAGIRPVSEIRIDLDELIRQSEAKVARLEDAQRVSPETMRLVVTI